MRCGRLLRWVKLCEFRELCVEITEGARELFAVTAVLRAFELFLHLRTRELQDVLLAAHFHFVTRKLLLAFAFFFGLMLCHLPFHGFALPPSRHVRIV